MKVCWFLILTILPVAVNAQDLKVAPLEAARIAEELFTQQDLDVDYEQRYETVLQYLSSPLDINRASVEELRSLFLLSEEQVQALLAHREKNGDVVSIYELQSISSFSPEFIRKLAPFITVGSAQSTNSLLRRIFTERNNYFLIRYERLIESKAGFSSTQDSAHRFIGTPDKYYARFRVSHPGEFSVGITMEKDPGEKSITDYISFHYQQLSKKRIQNFIVGDFQALFGQGLVLGGGFGMGKGSETILTVRRNGLGFVPWTSSAESGFFRGTGLSWKLASKFQVHMFASRRMQDALLKLSSVTGDTVASPQSSGLHRNAHEAMSKGATAEDNAGLVVEYKNRALQAGASFMHTQWQTPLAGGQDLYNRFQPSGRRFDNASIFFNYSYKNFSFFGESAQTIGYGAGAVAGVLTSVTRSFDVAILARKYSRSFWSPYGSGFAENSEARNESGVYWGWKMQPSRRWLFSGYVDLFKFPWLQYRAYSTSGSGHDALFRATWNPSRDVSVFAQVREETKPGNIATTRHSFQTSDKAKMNYSLNADYTLGILKLRTRVQLSSMSYLTNHSRGMAIFQDVNIDKPRWSLTVRQVLFDTDDFDNRQYAYEPDMWLAYSFPAYYGQGTRSMVMARVRLARQADLWIRWAHTRQEGRDAYGSGLDEIVGPARNDIKVQFRLRL